jgi:hypothetical protein
MNLDLDTEEFQKHIKVAIEKMLVSWKSDDHSKQKDCVLGAFSAMQETVFHAINDGKAKDFERPSQLVAAIAVGLDRQFLEKLK